MKPSSRQGSLPVFQYLISTPLTNLSVIGLLVTLFSQNAAFAQGEPFSKRVVATGFNSAWEVVHGPNDSLWVTENRAYLIQRVSIATGAKTQLINIKTSDPAINLPSTGGQAQGGLMGLVVHPNLYSTDPAVRAAKPWVYAAYVVARGNCPASTTYACAFTTKIVRYTYSGNTLTSPVTILDNIPGSSDHNSGRLIMSPAIEPGADAAHTQYRLYYTVGDMGAGQFMNTMRNQNSLKLDTLEGKVLRLNSESDGDAGADAWIPNDNPFYNSSAITNRDYVYSYGHRNAQGLAWGTNGTDFILYSSEQMDKTDDEINIIKPGKNYGWDSVAGYNDGNVNGTRIGQTISANEQNFCTNNPNHEEPIFTTFTATAAQVATMPGSNSLWPTLATSSIDFYWQKKIPGWNYCLLISPLKRDRVYRLQLNATGSDVIGDTIPYFAGDGNRIRRVIVSRDGRKFYVARDANAALNPGSIMEYTYTGVLLAMPDRPDNMLPSLPDEIKIYPNPAKDVINVKTMRNLYRPLKVQFFDMSGVKVKEEVSNRNDFTVDISSLRSGMYVMKLLNGYNIEVKVQKIYKQ